MKMSLLLLSLNLDINLAFKFYHLKINVMIVHTTFTILVGLWGFRGLINWSWNSTWQKNVTWLLLSKWFIIVVMHHKCSIRGFVQQIFPIHVTATMHLLYLVNIPKHKTTWFAFQPESWSYDVILKKNAKNKTKKPNWWRLWYDKDWG